MPQPHGTFLRNSGKDKLVHGAKQDRNKSSATAVDDQSRAAFYKALDRHSESELKGWQKSNNAFIERLKKKQRDNQTDDDSDLRLAAKILRHTQELLEKAKDSQEFVAMVGRDGKTVIAASPPKVGAGWDLAVCLAIAKVLEVIVRLRNK